MDYGFVKVAAATPEIRVADCAYNTEAVLSLWKEADALGCHLAAFPELVLTGATCGDLFLHQTLLDGALAGLKKLVEESKALNSIGIIGMPLVHQGKLYNCAVTIQHGAVLSIVPKAVLSDQRQFTAAPDANTVYSDALYPIDMEETLFGSQQVYICEGFKDFTFSVGFEDDFLVPLPLSASHAMAGANIIVNLNASCEMVDCMQRRRQAVLSASDRLLCGYVMASAGEGESTQDGVFGGHHLIAENGLLLAESQRFVNDTIYSDIDISRIAAERVKNTSYISAGCEDYNRVEFVLSLTENTLDRVFASSPFVPKDEAKRIARCEEIFAIQANALKKRMEHTKCGSAVIGVSGGLDSTLAMLVIAKAFDLLGLDRSNIRAVTMPCFGTTDRTYDNACLLTKALGATLQEVDIKKAVTQHLSDIGQDMDNHDVTYENAQARERTQVLMDIANQCNGMVIGTGDLSELALGWATYNGDHMSMYGVNGAIPKTLVRHLVRYYADTCEDAELAKVLFDVLDTPVSPELLPPVDGVISQKTEDLVGPYELHDFFLYYMLRCGFSPAKIYRIAKLTFANEYDNATILKWLKKFYWRFFSQQFKRSCLPDGPKVGSVGVSPRGDLHMPSDACVTVWIEELERLV